MEIDVGLCGWGWNKGGWGGSDRDTTAYFTAQESPGVCVVTDTTKAAPNIELSAQPPSNAPAEMMMILWWAYNERLTMTTKLSKLTWCTFIMCHIRHLFIADTIPQQRGKWRPTLRKWRNLPQLTTPRSTGGGKLNSAASPGYRLLWKEIDRKLKISKRGLTTRTLKGEITPYKCKKTISF